VGAAPATPLAVAALFAAAKQAAARGAALDPAWDPLIASAATSLTGPEVRRLVAALPEARRELLQSMLRALE
jgi:hypothetical protein